jgi:hypothetical protein
MRLRTSTAVAGATRVLKPRYSAWLSAVYPRLFPAVIVLICGVQEGAPVLIPLSLMSLAMTTLGFTPLVWAIWRERADRPPVLRFWEDGSGMALEVRRQHTGEILLRRRDPHLQSANLRHAKLSGANLRGVSLRAAKLRHAALRGADLRKAELVDADLGEADLRRAKLNGARLIGARFGGANLCGADLWGADLGGANDLAAADFSHARYDGATRWPIGFDPVSAGAVCEASGEAGLPIPHAGKARNEAKLPIPTDGQPQLAESPSGVARIGGRA